MDKELQALERDARELGEAYPPPGITCIHIIGGTGVCQQCWDDYNQDPQAWLEYGDHPEGIARWQQLQAEIDAEEKQQVRVLIDDSEIPF